MTFNPYHNRIPYGLLTDKEKAALEATGGPWEFWDGEDGVWRNTPSPAWISRRIYRAVRKTLPVPQEGDVWVKFNASGAVQWTLTLPEADTASAVKLGYRLFREVKADD
jgi:hypothetical protein